jgi:hypothetical protein
VGPRVEGVAGASGDGTSWRTGHVAEEVVGERVTDDCFEVLGVASSPPIGSPPMTASWQLGQVEDGLVRDVAGLGQAREVRLHRAPCGDEGVPKAQPRPTHDDRAPAGEGG